LQPGQIGGPAGIPQRQANQGQQRFLNSLFQFSSYR
jgi:hypothetical protein